MAHWDATWLFSPTAEVVFFLNMKDMKSGMKFYRVISRNLVIDPEFGELKDRITPQVNFFQQATKERQRRHGVSKKEKRDGEGLVWSKLCVDEYV